jgi:hypothetical protein
MPNLMTNFDRDWQAYMDAITDLRAATPQLNEKIFNFIRELKAPNTSESALQPVNIQKGNEMTAPLTSDELESILNASGLDASAFADAINMDPRNFRRMRKDLREGLPKISATLSDAIRFRFGGRNALLSEIATEALTALIELEQAYGRDARPPHAPDPRAPWERARRIIARARKGGVVDTPTSEAAPPTSEAPPKHQRLFKKPAPE